MTRETFYTSQLKEVSVSKDMSIFMKGKDLLMYFAQGRKPCYINIFLRVLMSMCLCGCLSVNDNAIVRIPPFAIQAVSSHLSVLSSHCFRQSSLPFQTPGEACESI